MLAKRKRGSISIGYIHPRKRSLRIKEEDSDDWDRTILRTQIKEEEDELPIHIPSETSRRLLLQGHALTSDEELPAPRRRLPRRVVVSESEDDIDNEVPDSDPQQPVCTPRRRGQRILISAARGAENEAQDRSSTLRFVEDEDLNENPAPLRVPRDRKWRLRVVSDSNEDEDAEGEEQNRESPQHQEKGEYDSEVPVRTRKGRKRVQFIVPGNGKEFATDDEDSDEHPVNTPRARKRLRLSTPDSDQSELQKPTAGSRVHRRLDNGYSEADIDLKIDSDAQPKTDEDEEIEDLRLPTPLLTPRLSRKEESRRNLKKYSRARKRKFNAPLSSGSSSSSSESEESSAEETERSRGGGDTPEGGDTDTQLGDGGSFIDDEHPTNKQEVTAALGPACYATRTLEKSFAVFVEYIARLCCDPELLSKKDNQEFYEPAISALRRYFDGIADAIPPQTWSGSFKATITRRPVLIGPLEYQCLQGTECEACWARGDYACNRAGVYVLSTQKGFYDREWKFDDVKESKQQYGNETTHEFANSAQAVSMLYAPGYRLTVGERCARKAAAYHQARHYMYSIASRVRSDVQNLFDHYEDLPKNPDFLIEHLEEDELTEELWSDFLVDQEHWKGFVKALV